jgi:hypothetical protein
VARSRRRRRRQWLERKNGEAAYLDPEPSPREPQPRELVDHDMLGDLDELDMADDRRDLGLGTAFYLSWRHPGPDAREDLDVLADGGTDALGGSVPDRVDEVGVDLMSC